MTTVTNNVQMQMDTMNKTLMNLQDSLLRLVGVPEEDLPHRCAMTTTTQDTTTMGIQPVPFGGLGQL